MRYNWQQDDWPNFRYDRSGLESQLRAYADRCNRISGLLQGLGEEVEEGMQVVSGRIDKPKKARATCGK